MKKLYEWKRFWHKINFSEDKNNENRKDYEIDENGYLIDPDERSFLTEQQDIHPLENFDNYRCLVLLGEPGMGKSTEIQKYINKFKNKANNKIKLIQLKAITSKYYDFNEAFRNDPLVKKWMSDKSNLTLILDSFDEGELFTQNLEFALHTIISNLPFTRLRLLITCRPTIWPTSLSIKLEQIFSTKEILHIKLAPLRKKDISIALEQEGIPIDSFFSQIEEKNVSFFATNPTSLDFLIKKYKSEGEISGNKYDIFLDGCQQLCTEFNESYETKGFELNAQDRMIIAGRISYLYIFSDKKGIVDDDLHTNENYLGFPDICKVDEVTTHKKLHLTNTKIKEVLNTSLFTRENTEYSFTTKSYAEFLAAWYIHEHALSIKKLKGLFAHPFSTKIIPQLHEVAAWVANKNIDFFDFCIEKEPIILLNADLGIFSNEQKKKLLSALILQFEISKFVPNDLLYNRKIKKIAYQNVENDIAENLIDKSKNERLRLFLIQLTAYCKLVVLEKELLQIAFDNKDDHYLRIRAADAISEISSTVETKEKLLELINDDDYDDNFRGVALYANYQTNLPAKKFFDLLIPPKQDNYYGEYRSFLHHFESKISEISNEHLLAGYDWINNYHILRKGSSILHEIVEGFVIESWNRVSNPEILDKVSKLIIRIIRKNGKLFENYKLIHKTNQQTFIQKYQDSDSDRRTFIIQLIKNIKNDNDLSSIIFTSPPLILTKDFDWFISLYEINLIKRDISDDLLLNLLFHTFNRDNQEQFLKLYQLSEKNDKLKRFFQSSLGPIKFDSDTANLMTWSYQSSRVTQNQYGNIDNEHNIDTFIEQVRIGNNNIWPSIDAYIINNHQLTTNSHITREYDLTQYNNWNLLLQDGKLDLIEVAVNYLSSINFEKYHYESALLFRLFYLLYNEKKIAIDSLSRTDIENWAKLIIKLPFRYYLLEQNDIKINSIFSYIADKSNSFTNKYFQNHIKPNSSYLDDNILHNVRFFWNESNEKTLTNCIEDLETNLDILPQLINTLFQNNSEIAKFICDNVINSITFEDTYLLQRQLIFAHMYLRNDIENAWNIIWPIIQNNSEFGKNLFLKVSSSFHWESNNSYLYLNPIDIGKLFEWLMINFPPSEDPKIIGSHAISPREELTSFRDWIPKRLHEISDKDSISELESMNKKFPDNASIKYYLYQADEIFRKNTWQPATIDQLLDILLSSSKRYIQNPEQLVEVILDSLEKLQSEVKGETSPVNFLWNEWKDNKSKEISYRPKEENRLSDYVKIYLQKEIISHGIIVNREVEVKPKTGDVPGQNIDIQVDAINLEEKNEENRIISVTIEVKGCWNKEIKTSMENQLLKRYLTDSNTDHGIYLIGWYKSNIWDPTDSRKNKCRYAAFEKTQNFFSEQAINLSSTKKHLYSFILDLSLPKEVE